MHRPCSRGTGPAAAVWNQAVTAAAAVAVAGLLVGCNTPGSAAGEWKRLDRLAREQAAARSQAAPAAQPADPSPADTPSAPSSKPLVAYAWPELPAPGPAPAVPLAPVQPSNGGLIAAEPVTADELTEYFGITYRKVRFSFGEPMWAKYVVQLDRDGRKEDETHFTDRADTSILFAYVWGRNDLVQNGARQRAFRLKVTAGDNSLGRDYVFPGPERSGEPSVHTYNLSLHDFESREIGAGQEVVLFTYAEEAENSAGGKMQTGVSLKVQFLKTKPD
ncbi:MAG: hypothetical protein JXR37_20310 [Kiritimatiellae bacterium]|nr:hypothetical protein [Kiritimatiellia bacterium]